MYAIIADSGRQYRVEKDLQFCVDFREVEPGQSIVFDQVLAISNEGSFQLGKPTVAGATVMAEVIGDIQGEKLIVQKFRRRKNSRRKNGHRQKYTKVVVKEIRV